ncbi:MAG: hypothetical protein IKO05_02445 [Selenomonadaceae bacterium]|nr:hypothetical protein [Selenomonadaceae bacterium]
MNAEKTFARADKQFNAKNYDAALKTLEKLKRYEPSFKKTYILESMIWKELNNYVKELAAAEKALSLLKLDKPEERNQAVSALVLIAYALANLGMTEEAVEKIRLVIKNTEKKELALLSLSSAIYYGSYLENFSDESLREFYAGYKKLLANIKPYPRKFYDHEKIRVGFLSSDLCWHPVLKWTWPLLTSLDKNRFVSCFYANVEKPDNLTDIVRSHADVWRDILNLTDEQAAKLIRDDEIDILFDLNGHTTDNRLPVAMYHPASVQLSGIGYVNSTGLDCFEYFLADVHCASKPEYFVEKFIVLPHSQGCYDLREDVDPAEYPPCVKNNFVTFGCFNQFKKINASMLAAWKAIMEAVPGSRLLLKNGIFSMEDGKKFASERLKNFGFDLDRVELRGWTATHPADYNDVDIALDTFPYTGVTTTAEALYMGVPVVSLYSDRFGTRLGRSILNNVGLYELAVDSYEEYIKRAVALANDWELLTILKKNLRPMMKKSPLMDAKLYVSDMQDAFIKILNEQKNLWREKNFLEGSR